MANSSNAYITKEANTVNPSDWINKQQQVSQYYDELARQQEKEELARKDKLRSEYNKDFDGEFDLSSMGNDVVNKIYTPLANQSLVDLKEAKDEGEKALNTYGINSKEYRNAKTKYDNIMQRPKLFKLLYEGASSKLNNYSKQVQEGKIYQSPENIKKLQEITKTPIKFRKNELGEMVVQQGENTYRLDEFADKLDLGKPIYKVDENSIISEITKSIGDKEFDKISGYTTTTSTNPWEDYKDPNGQKLPGIKSILTNGFESALTDDVMESVLAGKGQFGYSEMSPETKEELKAKTIENWLEVGRGQMEEKFKTSFNSSKYSTDASNSRSNSKSEDTSSQLSKNRSKPTQSVWGDKIKNIDAGNRFSVQPSKTVQIGNRTELQLPTANTIKDLDTGKSYSNATIESYTFDNKGNLITKISYVDDKGASSDIYDEDGNFVGKKGAPETKKTAIVRADADVKRNIANFLEITTDDLWNLAVENNGQSSNQQTNTKKPVYKGLDEDGNPIFE